MKIKIDFSKKSIDKAISQMEQVKKDFVVMRKEFFQECCNYFLKRANHYLDTWDIGQDLKNELQSGWSCVVTDKGAKIVNSCEKAAYVEFGVGIKGESYPHPMASENNYQYDTDTGAKAPDGSWVFSAEEGDLNIRQDDLTVIPNGKGIVFSDTLSYHTFGTEGVMFAYNALIDLQNKTRQIWQDIKVKYWG